jgi:hypothetical protein
MIHSFVLCICLYLRDSHRVPWYPGRHEHKYGEIHVPPFKHGRIQYA